MRAFLSAASANRLIFFSGLLCLFPSIRIFASSTALHALELEQLMQMTVTSVSKRSQSISDTAAAVYVITQDEIQRSGANNLPDILRLAPGVQVARLDASFVSISIRGFNTIYSNKLLVLIDGRSIYSPLFSGVFWESYLPMIEDIDRIEIIRGPGASVWGANAVNGVINILTKPAELTQSEVVAAGAGQGEKIFARGRAGTKLENGFVRGYATYRNRDASPNPANGFGEDDDYSILQTGLRLDWFADLGQRLTLQADVFRVDRGYPLNVDPTVIAQANLKDETVSSEGGNIALRYEKNNPLGIHTFHTYVERHNVNDMAYDYDHRLFDFDYQFSIHSIAGHQLSTGLEYRYYEDRLDGTYVFSLRDDAYHSDMISGFIQDTVSITENLDVIAGVKLEDHTLSDLETQPTLRAIWSNAELSVWVALSKATRTPSEVSQALNGNGSLKAEDAEAIRQELGVNDQRELLERILGSEQFTSESLVSTEFGIRWAPNENWYSEISGYYFEYDDLRTFDVTNLVQTDEAIIVELQYGNKAKGRTDGFEYLTQYQMTDDVKLEAQYNYWHFEAVPDSGHPGTGVSSFEALTPRHQAMVKVYYDYSSKWQWNMALRYVSALEGVDADAYTTMDFHLRYQLASEISLSLIGRDLFNSPRVEYQDFILGPSRTEVESSLFLQVKWEQ